MNLFETVKNKIIHENGLPFVEFMQLALYNPQYGYYSSSLPKFGFKGDFITAPELTSLFGQTLANQLYSVLSIITEPMIFEFGAGSGRLCVDILQQLNNLKCLPDTYYIMELSGHLRHRQQALFKKEIPQWFDRICWLDRLPNKKLKGVVIANEVLDAMPVHRFFQREQGVMESHVILNSQGQLDEHFIPSINTRLVEHVNQIVPKELAPYLSEANLWVEGWLEQIDAFLEKGIILLIDYGFPQHEYYHADRNTGTLMCHYQHQAHTNPFIHLGEQDITAHVDFTHVANAASNLSFHVAGYTNQASFLLANGLLKLLEELTDPLSRMKANQAAKRLLHPNEMGELFKVMALSKNFDAPLEGFGFHDKRASL